MNITLSFTYIACADTNGCMWRHYFVFATIAALTFILATDDAKATTASQEDLITLARKEFTKFRSENEKKAFYKFFRNIQQGKIADYRPESTDRWTLEILTNPVYSELWDKDRIVDSDWLVWLCRNKKASKEVPSSGINIAGALITGEINLESVRTSFPIRMSQCAFDEPIILRSSHIVLLDLAGSTIQSLSAFELSVEDSVFLNRGFTAAEGVDLRGATIGKRLDCEGGTFFSNGSSPVLDAEDARIEGSVFLRKALKANTGLSVDIAFYADGEVNLTNVKIGGNLDCDSGRFVGLGGDPALTANGADIHGSVFFRYDFYADGGVDLKLANIDKNLECQGGKFVAEGGNLALDANNSKIGKIVRLTKADASETGESNIDFYADGGVDFGIADIGGSLVCDGGYFLGSGKALALDADGAEIRGFVALRDDFYAEEGVDLSVIHIAKNLDCSGGRFFSTGDKVALNASNSEIGGSVFIVGDRMNDTRVPVDFGFQADGGVDLINAKIGGSLDCDGGHLFGRGDILALNASGADIHGSVFFRYHFYANGGVALRVASIGKDLECQGGQFFSNADDPALDASGADIGGSIRFSSASQAESGLSTVSNFIADGGVNLISAKIARNLECNGGKLVGNETNPALSADNVRIDGNAYFRLAFGVEGSASFRGANISGEFQWIGMVSPEKASLDLSLTKVGSVSIARYSWPAKRMLLLDGFGYDQFSDQSLADSEVELHWLALQPPETFHAQPFDQLASVLRKMGLQEESIKVLIAKAEKEGQYTITDDKEAAQGAPTLLNSAYGKKLIDLCWYKYLGRFIGYGYRPWHALYASLAIMVLGWFIFQIGYSIGIIIPADEDAAYGLVRGWTGQLKETYPKYSALIYSVETFVPLVKLEMAEYWIPSARHWGNIGFGRLRLPVPGFIFRWYLWLHIMAGWVLTTLWVGGFTGLLKT